MPSKPLKVGDRVRDRYSKKLGTIKCGSLIHGNHYQVTMDEGFDTLLIAEEIEPLPPAAPATADTQGEAP